ncbi:MAG: hypothetical protein ACQXXF_04675 [Thermoplasmatota archaeon]|jgi:hypothetical protein
MPKNDNINIKIEVCKEKNTGKLSIVAKFDSNAPNVAMDKEGYFWIPTFEEKEFINEAFELIPMDNFTTSNENEEKIKEKFNTKNYAHLPNTEKQKPQSVFQKTYDTTKDDPFENKNILEKKVEVLKKRNETEKNNPSYYEKETGEKEERIMVEADDAAIEAALKKHKEEDNSFVEVDEQTIIDKVLSQKKKGKWNNK